MSSTQFSTSYFSKFKQNNWLKNYVLSFIDAKGVIPYVLMYRKKKKSLLVDFGCGPGWFTKHVDSYFRVIGIDISDEALNMAKINSPRSRFYQGSLDVMETLKDIDVITCFDVLEHVEKPKEFLEKFHSRLKKDGLLVVSFPNTNSLAQIVKKKHWWAYEDSTHCNLWPEEKWLRLFERNGFKKMLRFSSGIINHPQKKYCVEGWLSLLHYITQPLGILGVPLPSQLTDTVYFVFESKNSK